MAAKPKTKPVVLTQREIDFIRALDTLVATIDKDNDVPDQTPDTSGLPFAMRRAVANILIAMRKAKRAGMTQAQESPVKIADLRAENAALKARVTALDTYQKGAEATRFELLGFIQAAAVALTDLDMDKVSGLALSDKCTDEAAKRVVRYFSEGARVYARRSLPMPTRGPYADAARAVMGNTPFLNLYSPKPETARSEAILDAISALLKTR